MYSNKQLIFYSACCLKFSSPLSVKIHDVNTCSILYCLITNSFQLCISVCLAFPFRSSSCLRYPYRKIYTKSCQYAKDYSYHYIVFDQVYNIKTSVKPVYENTIIGKNLITSLQFDSFND